MYVWIGSLLFYFYIYGFCCSLRWLLHRFVPKDPNETPWFAAIFEFLGTIQVVAPIFDIDIIWEAYGIVAVFFQVLLFEYLNWRTIYDALATPLLFVSAKKTAALRRERLPWLATGQLLGALISYPMTLLFWRFELLDEHADAYGAEECENDLTVSVLNGCIIECIGAFAVRYFELYTTGHRFEAGINSLWCALLTAVGIHFTGFYIHPLMASILTLGCGDLNAWPHFKVYWIAPMLGWYGAELVWAVKTQPKRLKHSYEIKLLSEIKPKTVSPSVVEPSPEAMAVEAQPAADGEQIVSDGAAMIEPSNGGQLVQRMGVMVEPSKSG